MTDEEYEYLFRDADPRWKAYYRMRREEYRKQHPLTNFEKWKEGLTAEMFANIQVVDREAFLEWANAEYKETRHGHLFEQLRRLAYGRAYLLPTSSRLLLEAVLDETENAPGTPVKEADR